MEPSSGSPFNVRLEKVKTTDVYSNTSNVRPPRHNRVARWQMENSQTNRPHHWLRISLAYHLYQDLPQGYIPQAVSQLRPIDRHIKALLSVTSAGNTNHLHLLSRNSKISGNQSILSEVKVLLTPSDRIKAGNLDLSPIAMVMRAVPSARASGLRLRAMEISSNRYVDGPNDVSHRNAVNSF